MTKPLNLPAPSPRRPALLGLAAAFLLSPWATAPGQAAQDFLTPQKQPFHLRAAVDDRAAGPQNEERPQLSREDVALIPPQSQPPLSRFDLGAGEGVNLAPPQRAQQEEPQSSLNEYGVDWSRWVGELNDRWYLNLKNLEDQSGYQFHTVRPALIKFTCYPNGQIGDISLKQSSGVDLYDRMQVEALLQVTPLPPFPRGTQRTSFTLMQGWESHPRKRGEQDYRPGGFARGIPMEIVRQWFSTR